MKCFFSVLSNILGWPGGNFRQTGTFDSHAIHFSFLFQADLASPYRPRFKAIYESDVPKIFCLQHTGIVANWTDFKPPFKNKVVQQSRLYLLFATIYLIYTKRINPKLATESECNHIMCPSVCVCSFQTFNLDLKNKNR